MMTKDKSYGNLSDPQKWVDVTEISFSDMLLRRYRIGRWQKTWSGRLFLQLWPAETDLRGVPLQKHKSLHRKIRINWRLVTETVIKPFLYG